MNNSELALQLHDVRVSYGTVAAVDGVDLDVPQGEIVGLIGPNGAGKTTLIDAITGFVRCTGVIRHRGKRVSGQSAVARVHRGISRTFQSLELFEDLTVRENLLVAASSLRWWTPLADMVRPGRPSREARVDELLGSFQLDDIADVLPADLPHGRRRLVSVARALAGEPDLVLLDEPGAGLDDDETAELSTRIRQIKSDGTTVLLIDHDMSLIMPTCDRVYVLDFGRVIASGTPDEIRNDDRVIRAYLGTDTPAEPR
jgi:ABC-type branched-subunit amino acid transport system ATPase component